MDLIPMYIYRTLLPILFLLFLLLQIVTNTSQKAVLGAPLAQGGEGTWDERFTLPGME
ncbi:hypothetical protein KFU94_29565 [Chloroflexi bacterium TSY]|nr:hypothetical protein [Chloroflexi bacterium TSY]